MRRPDFITAKEAVGLIKDGSNLCAISMTHISSSMTILNEIEREFLATGHPRDLTFIHSCGQSAMKMPGGKSSLAHEGLLKRIIGGHWGQSPEMMALISGNKIEAYNLPQGQMANMYHSIALREPGKISKIGLGTYVDPRVEGGKMNQLTKDQGEDIVEVIEIHGEEYLLYKEFRIDTLIIRGTYADENGNISMDEEGMILEVLPAVMACKRWGGRVIAQVKQIVSYGQLQSKDVIVPGALVDNVVVCTDWFHEHKQTWSWYYKPEYAGKVRIPETSVEPAPMNERKVIGRRAAMELRKDNILNIGTGIPNDVMGPILSEERAKENVVMTVESGIWGGTPAKSIDFGVACNADALVGHDRQFEFYTGTGADITFMGAGQLDQYGNVNATRMGDRAPGAGGFVDITATAKKVVFCSTFTAKGLKVSFDEEKGVTILQEGSIKKMVDKVLQISYNAAYATKSGQKMLFITERCVFEYTPEGMKLIEIAKGIDLQKDILDQMEFTPIIADDLKIMDTRIYKDGVFGLNEIILNA